MMDDLIRRLAVLDVLNTIQFELQSVPPRKKELDRDGLGYLLARIKEKVEQIPSVQPEDWREKNKERILQAGMEGREIEFRIGGRLFAIREKAQ